VGTFQDNVFIEGQLFNSDTTENTLGDVDSGSVQLDGGLGVAKNTTIGAGLSVLDGLTVVGLSTFVGIVTTSSDLFVGGDLFISVTWYWIPTSIFLVLLPLVGYMLLV